MSRNRKSAKAAGARFERLVADYLAEHVSDVIDRRVKTGANDKGDIGGLRHLGNRIVVEAKDYGGQVKVGPWLTEAEVERNNGGADVGLVVAKRRGTADPSEQIVMLTLGDLVRLLRGAA